MAYVFGRCEMCHQHRPVRAHWPLLYGMSWLCLACHAVLVVRQRLKGEVRK